MNLKTSFLRLLIVSLIISLFFIALNYRQLASQGIIWQHTDYAVKLYNGEPMNVFLERLPHLAYFYLLIGLHQIGFSFSNATVLVLTLSQVLGLLITYAVYRHFLDGKTSDGIILAIVVASIIVGAIYFPLVNPSPYFGTGNPNNYHNSTTIVMRPIAILCFFFLIHVFQQDKKPIPHLVFGALLLALSVLIKPTFVLVFVPAAGLWVLTQPGRLKNIVLCLLLLLPSAVVLLQEYLSYYQVAENNRGMTFIFFDLWLNQSRNIPLALLLALAFPLAISILRFQKSRFRAYHIIAWLMTFFGAIQFAFLAETQNGELFLESVNWVGGYLVGLTVLYLTALLEFLDYSKDYSSLSTSDQRNIKLLGLLLWLHLLSGFVYFASLFYFGYMPVPVLNPAL